MDEIYYDKFKFITEPIEVNGKVEDVRLLLQYRKRNTGTEERFDVATLNSLIGYIKNEFVDKGVELDVVLNGIENKKQSVMRSVVGMLQKTGVFDRSSLENALEELKEFTKEKAKELYKE